jgi:uncharacterized membrane protein
VDWFSVVFRVIHIGSAIVWAGGAAFFFFYVEPTINKLGPDAESFVDELLRRKLPIYFLVASSLAVIGGVSLYIRDAGGVRLWLDSTAGTVFTIGGLSAIIAWIGGNALIPSTAIKMQGIVHEMKAAAGPPPADALDRLHAAQERLRAIGAVDLLLIAIAIVCMETARYLG